ncbi:acyl-CoA dehydrogenase family protein [Aurantiacibacter rhizosphaerae]|uniref:acyl-CoA dehydrogenase family protein n=1 Tax=Aurantiacibacter rhizosphaerae TaxID=2691582 RepID=UPI001F47D40C|nr:acyl-CoA dehydrogenase family protein [Aurantiacibacter rhizosphaerae]
MASNQENLAGVSQARIDALLAELPARRDEITTAGRLPADIVEKLRGAGIYRAMVAKRFGGEEISPAQFMQVIEKIAAVDASVAWVASFGFSATYLSALPISTLEKMYAEGPDVIFAGGIFPPQPAPRVDGGYLVSGRWSWGSGSTGADLVGVGIKGEAANDTGGLPLIAVMPASKITIEENWDVDGLKGTGSHDMVASEVVVPEEWTFVRGGKSSLDEPLYRYPSMALAAQVLAVVALGAARGSIDHLMDMAAGRGSITGAPTLAKRAFVQADLAKAEAKLRSARCYFFDSTERSYARLETGDDLSREEIMSIRLAATHAARTGAEVCHDIYRISGTTGIFTASTIGRQLQDALIVPQHAFLSEGTFTSAGQVLLGQETTPGYP